MTHEYLIKTFAKIEIDNRPGQALTSDITYDQNTTQTVFYVNQYFKDFKNAFEQYYDQLKYNTSGSMLQNIEKALQSLNSSLISKLHKDFRADVSGNRI